MVVPWIRCLRYRVGRCLSGSVGPRVDRLGEPVIAGLAYGVIGLALVATGWGIATAIANRAPGRAQLLCAALLELVIVVQSVIGLVKIAAGFRPVAMATTVGYLIAIVILMPVAWFWANTERTRFSGVVLAIAAISVGAMTLRLIVLWDPAALG